MSDSSIASKISKIKPVGIINYDSSFDLSEFQEGMRGKFSKLDYYEKNMYRRIEELKYIHKDIILTLDRINEHISLANRQLELFNKMGDRTITKVEEKEYRESVSYDQQGYLNLDVRILFVLIGVFMDKMPRLLNSLLKRGKKPKGSSFYRYKNSIKKYGGKELDELKKIIHSTEWYYGKGGVKDIRDDYVIHHPAGQGLSSRGPNYISSTIATRRDEVLRLESISNESIQAIILVLEKFIRDIHRFIKENYNSIPHEISYS